MKNRLQFLSGMAIGLLLGTGCTGNTPGIQPQGSPVPSPTVGAFGLKPAALVLNVPATEAGPAPFAATGSFQVEGLDLASHPATWSIADTAIATIDAKGQVFALATGFTVVTLQVHGATQVATAGVEVVDRGGKALVTFE